jgi:hypothetical protein
MANGEWGDARSTFYIWCGVTALVGKAQTLPV